MTSFHALPERRPSSRNETPVAFRPTSRRAVQIFRGRPFIGFGTPAFGGPVPPKDDLVLIVARRKGQRIRIGENIEVVVTEISRGEVRLGIVAPKQVAVVREEMQRAVEDANRAAATSTLRDEGGSNEVSVVTELGVGAFSSSSAAGTRS
jgi:carbon storage regulator